MLQLVVWLCRNKQTIISIKTATALKLSFIGKLVLKIKITKFLFIAAELN